MQCRAVARRLAAGSLTVLGDLAQATSPWAAADWQQTLAGLGRPDTVVRPLTRGYRVPGEVLDFANRLLPLIAPGLAAGHRDPLRAGRRCGVRPVAALAGPLVEVVGELRGRARVDRRRLRRRRGRRGGRPAPRRRAGRRGPRRRRPRRAGWPSSRRRLAKGLEFDAVVVVDPAAIVAAEPRGLHRLYVVLTRAVSTLVVLHRGDLPEPLGPASGCPARRRLGLDDVQPASSRWRAAA